MFRLRPGTDNGRRDRVRGDCRHRYLTKLNCQKKMSPGVFCSSLCDSASSLTLSDLLRDFGYSLLILFTDASP